LTNGEAFSKLASPNRSGSGEGPLLPDVSSPLSDLQLAGLSIGRKKKGQIMYPSIKVRTTTPPASNSKIHSFLRRALFFVPALFVCFALSPIARALVPPPDGGYLSGNTAEGTGALSSLAPLARGIGFAGIDNTALGYQALYHNATSDFNTATGYQALYNNTDDNPGGVLGGRNTADGYQALFHNISGGGNTAIGGVALYKNTNASRNTAVGDGALFSNSDADGNTAIGHSALFSNSSGTVNTAVGISALENTTGTANIALGVGAGFNLTMGDFNIDIGNFGVAGESRTIRIGQALDPNGVGQTRTFIAGITGVLVLGDAVHVSSSGQLGILTSSKRFKDEIKPMDKASEAVLALKPVTFHYKKELDPEGIPQFGLVAEDVEKVSPALITRDADGKPYAVRYEAINAMLLNEFLKEHQKVQKQQEEIDTLRAELKAQRALIQNVSARLEVSKLAVQTVANNQ
jgi:Chaperone of endosialidase